MVEPDYQECLSNPADLRAAFHAAISLFHMHDWVWHTHEPDVRSVFSIRKTGTKWPETLFADALEKQYPDFGRVRGIANAAKHLELRDIRPVANAPRRAPDTAVSTGGAGGYGVGSGGYGVGVFAYAGSPRVVLIGPPETEFVEIAKAVYDMWGKLRADHDW
jgi:hypothetical protein